MIEKYTCDIHKKTVLMDKQQLSLPGKQVGRLFIITVVHSYNFAMFLRADIIHVNRQEKHK